MNEFSPKGIDASTIVTGKFPIDQIAGLSRILHLTLTVATLGVVLAIIAIIMIAL